MTAIRLLIGHRHNTYADEFAPEVFAVVDEWTLDENPQYWIDKVAEEKAEQGDDVEAWAEVEFDLNDEDLMRALYPKPYVAYSKIRPADPISEENNQ